VCVFLGWPAHDFVRSSATAWRIYRQPLVSSIETLINGLSSILAAPPSTASEVVRNTSHPRKSQRSDYTPRAAGHDPWHGEIFFDPFVQTERKDFISLLLFLLSIVATSYTYKLPPSDSYNITDTGISHEGRVTTGQFRCRCC
jgi:hypothetical protein